MKSNFSYFKGSLWFSVFGLALAAYIGYTGPMGIMTAIFITMVLSVLEISLSFDNAVVNATVLKEMDEKWRQRFLTWGIIIAVFGMRIVFPVIVVAILAAINPWEAMKLAASQPEKYAEYMNAAHVALMGFGGSFLLMVGLAFFLDDDEDKHHWIPFIEQPIKNLFSSLNKFNLAGLMCSAVITGAFAFAISHYALSGEDANDFLVAAAWGIGSFAAIDLLKEYMEHREEKRKAQMAGVAAKGGFAMFMYLEVLDASFSFDGVIGAFAITTAIFIIAIGLGIGAMFVRSMTIYLVEKDTLAQFKYLEHGAFYAIIALAVIMMVKSFMHVPELITGLIGAVFIGSAFYHSVMENRKEAAQSA